MKVQLSDFENAAYVIFIVLVTRAILTFKLNFMIPISKVRKMHFIVKFLNYEVKGHQIFVDGINNS